MIPNSLFEFLYSNVILCIIKLSWYFRTSYVYQFYQAYSEPTWKVCKFLCNSNQSTTCVHYVHNCYANININNVYIVPNHYSSIQAVYIQCFTFFKMAYKKISQDILAPQMLTHCDIMRYYISGSTVVEVMACCLMAPSQYLNQYWLIFIMIRRNIS